MDLNSMSKRFYRSRSRLSNQNKQSSDPLHVAIWRVRTISCDGGQPGREWSSEFFLDEHKASQRLIGLIAESDKQNPKYPFEKKQENLDGVLGYCNWQFRTMITTDIVVAR